MHGFRPISRLLAVFAIAGLLASPVVTRAAAKLLPASEMSDMSMSAESLSAESVSVDSMSADMSCCPDTQKSNDCQDCPLRAMCMLSAVQVAPSLTITIHEPLPTHRSFPVLDDLIAEGLDGRPPDHPPRILV